MLSANELTRKAIHVVTCLGAIYLYFAVGFEGLALFIILYLPNTYFFEKLGLLEKIKQVNRLSFGHYFLSLGILLTLGIYWLQPNETALIFALLVLGLADTIAALFPKSSLLKNSAKRAKNKTLLGSTLFALTTLIILISIGQPTPLKLLIVPILTLIEYFSPWGLDNLTIPVSSYLLFILFQH